MSKRDRMLLSVIGAVVVVGGAYWFLIKPARAEAQQKRDELAAIQDETGVIRDQISRLQKSEKDAADTRVEGFRLAKAVPNSTSIPGAIVQLQRLADRSDVDLAVLRTSVVTDIGQMKAIELEVKVTGRFFDVDDFMFRAHRMVTVDEKDRPQINGRLVAIKALELQVTEDDQSTDGGDTVDGDLHVLVFSAPSATAAAAETAATTTTGGTP
ncbi:MAG: type II secretion system protein GspM [Thermoleophilia bacterium]